MGQNSPNTNPRYENVTEMENVAIGEEDETCNMRLWAKGNSTEWLHVVFNAHDFGDAFLYYHKVGRYEVAVTRDNAQCLIDIEWGRK